MAERTPFAQRVITAFAFALILLGPIFIGEVTGLTIIGILCALTILEYLQLQGIKGLKLIVQVTIPMLMYLGVSFLVIEQGIVFTVEYGIYLGVAFALLLVWRLYKRYDPFAFRFQVLPATLYIALPLAFMFMITLWEGVYRPRLAVALLLLVWTNDTMAYLIGRKWGKHIFAPVISPKKTWEGTLGGWLSTLLMAMILGQLFGQFTFGFWIGLGIIVGVTGSIGDLIESLFKRKKNIKDSGTFLPGHGGFLDRLDSLLFCLPFVALFFLCCFETT
ncbi:MAG: phosphatidate cytidylyltransferase [Saprospiraceae bacterium]|nr:phosphatidate cytidylyltransferase [Saprospiraceae bacterium]